MLGKENTAAAAFLKFPAEILEARARPSERLRGKRKEEKFLKTEASPKESWARQIAGTEGGGKLDSDCTLLITACERSCDPSTQENTTALSHRQAACSQGVYHHWHLEMTVTQIPELGVP